MPGYLPISPSGTGVYYDKGFDGHEGEVAQTNQALEEMAARNLPIPYDPKKAVGLLRDLSDDERVDGHAAGMLDSGNRTLIGLIADGIAKNAVNPVGIEEGSGAYDLGPGDVKTHQALRDSNVLNAALGYANVPNVQALRDGTVHGKGAMIGTPVENLDIAASHWHKGEADPTHWANAAEAYYPQNSWAGQQGGISNVTENNGGSAWGNSLAWLGRWQNGGDRAIREPSEWSGPVVDTAKLVGGWAQGAEDEKQHQTIKGYINRPSPLLPKGVAPGSPEADSHLKELAALRDATVQPKSEDYAASQGRELSRLGKAFADNKLFWADPLTAATGIGGVVRGVVGKGAGAAAKAASAAARAEAISEGGSPMNYVGFLKSLTDDPASSMTPEQYRANSAKAHQAFADAEDVLGRYGR